MRESERKKARKDTRTTKTTDTGTTDPLRQVQDPQHHVETPTVHLEHLHSTLVQAMLESNNSQSQFQ